MNQTWGLSNEPTMQTTRLPPQFDSLVTILVYGQVCGCVVKCVIVCGYVYVQRRLWRCSIERYNLFSGQCQSNKPI